MYSTAMRTCHVRSRFGRLRRRGFRGERRGTAMIEFAIVLPMLVLLVLAIIEFGQPLAALQIVSNGAREGARRAILPGATDGAVQNGASNSLAGAIDHNL